MSRNNIMTVQFQGSSISEIEQIQAMISEKLQTFKNTRQEQIKDFYTLNTGEIF